MWWALSQIGKSRRQRQQALDAARKEGLEQGQANTEARMQTDLEYRRQVLSRGRPALRRRRRLRARSAGAGDAR